MQFQSRQSVSLTQFKSQNHESHRGQGSKHAMLCSRPYRSTPAFLAGGRFGQSAPLTVHCAQMVPRIQVPRHADPRHLSGAAVRADSAGDGTSPAVGPRHFISGADARHFAAAEEPRHFAALDASTSTRDRGYPRGFFGGVTEVDVHAAMEPRSGGNRARPLPISSAIPRQGTR